MTAKELKEFLRENLKVEIWCDRDGCGSTQVNVQLRLDDEVISSSSDYYESPCGGRY